MLIFNEEFLKALRIEEQRAPFFLNTKLKEQIIDAVHLNAI